MPLTEVEKAYLAGIIDGEGSISLARSHARSSAKYVYPLVRIANTDLGLIDWVKSRVPEGHRGYTSRLHDRCKDVYHVAWASNEAVTVLKEVLPYLTVKRFRAELVIRLWEDNQRARKEAGGYLGNGHPIPTWLHERRESAFAELQTLNKRGV